MSKQKETKIEYELLLRKQTATELILDVRKDTVSLDTEETLDAEYIEGFIYDDPHVVKNYGDAVTKFLELKEKYPDANEYDEILEEATDLLAIRYGNGSWEVGA